MNNFISGMLAFILGFSFVCMAHLADVAYHLSTWPGLPSLYITPDGVVLDWNKIAITTLVVVALSAFLTEGMAMISRAVSRRRDRRNSNTICPRIGVRQWTCSHNECTCHLRHR